MVERTFQRCGRDRLSDRPERDRGSSSLTVESLIDVGKSGQSLFDIAIEHVFAVTASIAPGDVVEAGDGSELGG